MLCLGKNAREMLRKIINRPPIKTSACVLLILPLAIGRFFFFKCIRSFSTSHISLNIYIVEDIRQKDIKPMSPADNLYVSKIFLLKNRGININKFFI